MSYCQVSDIEAEFKGLKISETTAITTAQVTEFINQASNEIDSKLHTKFITPITGQSSLLLLKQICTGIVAQRVKEILAVKSGKTDVDTETRADSAKAARKLLQDIFDDNLSLADATHRSTGGGVSSFNSSYGVQNTWKKGEDQW